MKRIIYIMMIVACTIFLTGCGRENKQTSDKITLTCTIKNIKIDGLDNQTKIIYEFNKDQISTGYTSITTQKFSDKETYELYKEEQEKTTKDNSNDNIKYELTSDDNNLTIELKMTITGLDKVAESEIDKDNLKLSKILESNKAIGSTCELNGIKESEIK